MIIHFLYCQLNNTGNVPLDISNISLHIQQVSSDGIWQDRAHLHPDKMMDWKSIISNILIIWMLAHTVHL